MKGCPFCAEEIQDAAIKCRYCGSMLDQPARLTAPVSPPTTAPAPVSRDEFEDVRELSDTEKFHAGLVIGRNLVGAVFGLRPPPVSPPTPLSTSVARAMLKGIQPSSKAYSPTPAQVAATRRGNRRDLAVLATVIVLALVAGTAWLSTSVSEAPQTPRPGLAAAPSPAPPRTSAQATPSAEDTTAAPKSTESAERVRRGAAARDAVAIFVKRGFIKRMDLERGRFYVDGPLWESFEFNDKQNMVKMISWYREAEYKGLPQVSLLESRSGKELANYGAFTGVTIR